MTGHRGPAAVLLVLGVTAALLTRLPESDPVWIIGVLAAAGCAAITGLSALFQEEGSNLRRLSVGALVVLLLIPPVPDSWVPWIPAPVVAVLVLGFIHFVYGDDSPAPRLDDEEAGSTWSTISVLTGAVLAAVLLLPWIFPLVLPDRLASIFALSSAAGPLVTAGLIVLAILIVVTFQSALDARRGDRGDEEPTAPTAGEEGSS